MDNLYDKKQLAFWLVITSWTIIIVGSSLGQDILYFMLAGAVPGTAYTVPRFVMLSIYAVMISIIFGRFVSTAARQLLRPLPSQKRLPKRRYYQI